MDFENALKAHNDLKLKVGQYFKKPNGSLDHRVVRIPNRGTFGMWLHNEARQYAYLPEYHKLVDAHKRFHKAAAEILRQADRGARVTEDEMMGPSSDYHMASHDFTKHLAAFKTAMAPTHHHHKPTHHTHKRAA